MLRQIYQALRDAVADFFDVPRQGVAMMLALIVLLVAYACARTFYTLSGSLWLRIFWFWERSSCWRLVANFCAIADGAIAPINKEKARSSSVNRLCNSTDEPHSHLF